MADIMQNRWLPLEVFESPVLLPIPSQRETTTTTTTKPHQLIVRMAESCVFQTLGAAEELPLLQQAEMTTVMRPSAPTENESAH
jgi:hypothetical protein